MTELDDRTDEDVAKLILQNCFDLGVGQAAAEAMVERSLQNRRKSRHAESAAA